MITTPIFTRLLNTAEYGKLNVFNSWTGILLIFVTMNSFYAFYEQGLIKYSNERAVFSSSMQGLTLTLTAFWSVIYFIFRDFWNSVFSLNTAQMSAMLVIIWTTAVYTFWAAEQRAMYKYLTLVIVTLFTSIAEPVLGIVFINLSEDKAMARILSITLVQFISYSGLFAVQMIRGKKFCSLKFWKSAVCFNLPLIPHYLSEAVLSGSDRIMIKNMVGESEAGIYGLAYSLGLVTLIFNSALTQTIGPWGYQKIKEKKEAEIAPIGYSTLIMIALINLALIVFAPEAVRIFAPEEYYAAIWVIPPVAMSGFFIYAFSQFSFFAFYYEKTKIVMFAGGAAALANLCLNYIFINKFGYIAAGYTTLVCYMLYAAGHYVLMKKTCKDYCEGRCPYSLKTIVPIAVVFLISGFLIMFTYNYIIIRYSIAAAAIVAAIIKRKYIAASIKKVMAIKKSADEN